MHRSQMFACVNLLRTKYFPKDSHAVGVVCKCFGALQDGADTQRAGVPIHQRVT